MMTKQRYLITREGLTYDKDRKRAEPGDVVDDLPANALGWLREQGYIEPVVDEPPTDEGGDGGAE